MGQKLKPGVHNAARDHTLQHLARRHASSQRAVRTINWVPNKRSATLYGNSKAKAGGTLQTTTLMTKRFVRH